MKIRFYKGDKTLHITETCFTPEYRLAQLQKRFKWASDEGVKWQVDGDILEPKPVVKKKRVTKKVKKDE